MAVDTFLKLGDIKGESKDSKHAGEIDVLSWSFGVSQTGTMGVGGGGGAGKANFSDLNIMHAVDKASPVLMTKCATGEHIKEATLISRKAGKGQQEYLIVKMNDILVNDVAVIPEVNRAADKYAIHNRLRNENVALSALEGDFWNIANWNTVE